VYSYAGKQLGTVNKISDIFSIKILSAFILLVLLCTISILFKRYKTVKNNHDKI